ncbi:MAG TPA: hypothetical protein VL137_03745 [Polyangiaceae bacterium]|nr:hypothetical protein [Polyangiaceae bacterium]
MSVGSLQELKQTLLSNGFEVFRTLGSRVVLADRVRDNLIMDSCVSAVFDGGLCVRIVLRAQTQDFPGESEEQLFGRVVVLGKPLHSRGYSEVERSVVPMLDPSDPSKRLDTWCEIAFQKRLSADQELHEELRYALHLAKNAG